MNFNLKNKKYVISAGADGIGFSIAKRIIKAGGNFCPLPYVPQVAHYNF